MVHRKIMNLSNGLPQTKLHHTTPYHSGIWKSAVDQLDVGFRHIAGDDVANHEAHGGPDRVVCVYPYEHYAYWEKELNLAPTIAAFGENLSVLQMREDQVCIGDIYQMGEAILQVSQGRYPCVTINKRNDSHLLLKRVFETGFTGYFLRVLREGEITTRSEIKQMYAHPKQVTVASIHQLYFHTTPTSEEIQHILDVTELAERWRVLLTELKNNGRR